MKSTNLSMFCLFIISISLNGQNYNPMLGDSNSWYYLSCFEGCYTELYCTHGDTTIGGLNYKVFGMCNNPSGTFLREDTSERKVYQRFNQNVELLMYDFNLQVGDSIMLQDYFSYFDGTNFHDSIIDKGLYHLDSIKLVNISIGIRKSFIFHSSLYSPLIWIEGVGTLGYPLQSFSIQMPQWNEINCFYKNDTLIYQSLLSQSYSACSIYLNINEIAINSIELYPNPTTNEIIISNTELFKNYKLYDLFGKILFANDICDKNLIIDLKTLPSGIYLLKLTGNNRILTKKIIKN